MKSAIPSTLQSGLVAAWFLDEASGTRAEIFNFTPLTDNNGVSQTVGKIDFAASFDTSLTQYLNGPHNVRTVFTQKLTFSCWVKLTANLVDLPAVFSRITGTNSQFFIGINFNDTPPTDCNPIVYATNSDFTDFIGSVADNTYDFTTYQHVVYVIDLAQPVPADKFLIYLNGNLIPITLAFNEGTPPTSFDPSTDDLIMGAVENGADTMDGAIDHSFLWNRVLTPYEVKLLYNNGNALRYPF